MSEWKNSLQFVQWVGWLAKLIRKLQLCFLVSHQLQNYLRPPWLPCNWGLLELRCTAGSSCVVIFQLITSDDSFEETELLFCRFTMILGPNQSQSGRVERGGERLDPNIQLSSGCDPSPNPHPGVSAACWSVIDQFPPPPNPPNDSQLAPGRTTPSCLAFN